MCVFINGFSVSLFVSMSNKWNCWQHLEGDIKMGILVDVKALDVFLLNI